MTSEPKRVLVVDDDDALRNVFRDLLLGAGYDVTTAHNGLEALQHLKSASKRPHLVLLDLGMPILDGFEFLALRKNDALLSAIPIILMTDRDEVALADDARSRETAEILVKPARVEEILGLVSRWCSGSFSA